jgi:hypothetical protein
VDGLSRDHLVGQACRGVGGDPPGAGQDGLGQPGPLADRESGGLRRPSRGERVGQADQGACTPDVRVAGDASRV